MLLQRYPARRRRRSSFFQKRVPKNAPDWLETTTVSDAERHARRSALVAADVAHLAWAVNLGCLGFHVWPYHADDPDHADELRHRPRPVARRDVRDGAGGGGARCGALLDELGIDGRPEDHRAAAASTSTSAWCRSTTRYAVRAAAVAVARELERRRPDLITAAWWKEERGERVFIDFNQNAPHKTVFGAWSVRRPARRAGVDAVPLGRARRRSSPTS